MPLIELSPFVIIFLLGVIEVFLQYTKKKPTWLKKNGHKLLIVLLLISCALGIYNTLEKNKKSITNENLLKEIRAYQGNQGLLEKYLQLAHEKNTKVSEYESKAFVEKLLTSLPERRRKDKIISIQEDTKLIQIKMNLEPFYDYVLQQFDERIKLLQKNDIDIQSTMQNQSLILPADSPLINRGFKVRDVKILRSRRITIAISPAAYQSGSIIKSAIIYIKEGNAGSEVILAAITIEENKFNLLTYRPEIKLYEGKGELLKDEILKQKITNLFNELLTVAVIKQTPK